jgi:hypothetical protein
VPAGPPVIVLGAEPSGTSVCAEMVHAWGAYAGQPGELGAADELNAHGRWEFLPLWDLLAAVGGFASGATWWQDPSSRTWQPKRSTPLRPSGPVHGGADGGRDPACAAKSLVRGRRLGDLNPGRAVNPNRISSAAP